jgi:3-oxoacyl-[acyl-carrier protein] reductase
MLTRVLAEELVADGISVNELVPGPVITPATEAERRQGDRIAAFETPGEWPKQPEDVVPLALFLAACPAPGPTAQSFSLMRRQG